jgi:hypothetical protein
VITIPRSLPKLEFPGLRLRWRRIDLEAVAGVVAGSVADTRERSPAT